MGPFWRCFCQFYGILILLGPDASCTPHATIAAQAMVILANMGYVSFNLMPWYLPKVPAKIIAAFFILLGLGLTQKA